MERRLFILQRLTAMVLAPLVLVHLGLVLVAIRGGLSAAAVRAGTQGSVGGAVVDGLVGVAGGVVVGRFYTETTSIPGGGRGR